MVLMMPEVGRVYYLPVYVYNSLMVAGPDGRYEPFRGYKPVVLDAIDGDTAMVTELLTGERRTVRLSDLWREHE